MRLEAVELRRIAMPLVAPFRTSFGVQTARDVLLVRVRTDGADGWGECVTPTAPIFNAEWTNGAAALLRDEFIPTVLHADDVTADGLATLLANFKGNHLAKAALESAVLDAECRAAGTSFATRFGATRERVPCGVSIGIPAGGVPELLDTVAAHLAQGYQRIKLKIEPGFDIAPVAAVRERFGPDLLLSVDANCAYTLDDAEHLAGFEPFGLLMIEQPFPVDHLVHHALLAELLHTPVCLDESITSVHTAVQALDLGAADLINIKPARVGGYLEAVRIHDACLARGITVWCGGMLETGIGRAANLALAALPGFTIPGDTSASARYWTQDITPAFVLEPDGTMAVPQGPGIGVEPLLDVIESLTTHVEEVRR